MKSKNKPIIYSIAVVRTKLNQPVRPAVCKYVFVLHMHRATDGGGATGAIYPRPHLPQPATLSQNRLKHSNRTVTLIQQSGMYFVVYYTTKIVLTFILRGLILKNFLQSESSHITNTDCC